MCKDLGLSLFVKDKVLLHAKCRFSTTRQLNQKAIFGLFFVSFSPHNWLFSASLVNLHTFFLLGAFIYENLRAVKAKSDYHTQWLKRVGCRIGSKIRPLIKEFISYNV